MNSEVTEVDNNQFDDIFFKNHGVGQFAKDPEYEQIAHTFDKSQPTLAERKFCRYIVNGDTLTEAYSKTFDKDNALPRSYYSTYANKLLKRDRVAKYMYDLQKELEELADETLPTLIAELNEDRQLARDMGQPSAAISAVKAKASLLGLEDNRSVTNNINLTISKEQKEALLKRINNKVSGINEQEAIDVDFEDITNE